jgi:hypothetical protein
MSKTLWKSMKAGPKSDSGNEGAWVVGQWCKHEGDLAMCQSGYHASRNVIDAMSYVDAEVIAQVEVRGKHLEQDDKQCWSEMRIIKAWPWTKADSVSLAIYAAELAIGIFEKRYPDYKRPRQAIDTAKKWLKEPTEENREATAGAARAAWAAAWAAEAARAAGAAGAAWAAEAAWAARAAGAAEAAAEAAAWATAGAKVRTRCHGFVLARLAKKSKED